MQLVVYMCMASGNNMGDLGLIETLIWYFATTLILNNTLPLCTINPNNYCSMDMDFC